MADAVSTAPAAPAVASGAAPAATPATAPAPGTPVQPAEDSFDWSDPSDPAPAEETESEGEDEGEVAKKPDSGESDAEESEGEAEVAAKDQVPADKKKPKTEEKDAGFDADLLKRAEDAGLSAEDAKGFRSPEALEHAVRLRERDMIAAATKEKKNPFQTEQAKPPEKKPETKVETPETDEAFPDLSEFDEKLTKPLRAAHERALKAEKALGEHAKVLESLVRAEQARHALAQMEWFDTQMDGLKDMADLFGGKAGDRGDKATDAFKNASKLWVEMRALEAGYAALGKQVPREQVFQRAVHAAFGEHARQIVNQQLTDKLNQRRAQFTNRSTNRNGAANARLPGSNTQKVLSRLEAKGGLDAVGESKDGLPD